MRIGIFSVADHYPGDLTRTTSQFYEETLDQAQQADEQGFDSFWIAEHHFHEYGAIPRPAVWLSAAAQRTTRIRLGTAVVVLPFDNPVRVAEDYAMVDVLSDGRLNLGIGSGYLKHEFEGFSLNAEEKRDRFDESLEILLRAWEGKPFSYEGKYFKIPSVKINVLPIQKPRPPILIASLRLETVPFVGRRGFPVMLIPYATSESIDDVAAASRSYSESYSAGGHSGAPRIVVALHLHCGESTAQARREALGPMDRYVRTRLYARQRSFDELVSRDLIAAGDPDEITRILRLYQKAGATDFLAISNFGGMPHQEVLRSMKLLSQDVIPEFSSKAEVY
jgi:alkanesulfonate monooxygenase SsuD/methylene tetrahydromethanopterin reductase-like flavin-dependent oxidoreductase (luciferase family)